MGQPKTNNTTSDRSIFTLVHVFSQKHTDQTGEVGKVEIASKGWEATFKDAYEMIDFVEGIEPNFDWGGLWA